MDLFSNKYTEVAKQLREHHESDDSIICQLKEAGASQVETVRAFVSGLGYTLKEADQLIIYSAAWADHYDATMMVRELFFEILIESADQVEQYEDGRVLVTVELKKQNDDNNPLQK